MKHLIKDLEIEYLYKSHRTKDKIILALSETIELMEKRIRELESKGSHHGKNRS